MRRYYFCTQHHETISDEDMGVELADDHTAWATATAAAAKFLENADGSLQPNVEWRIDVQDEARRPLYAVRIVAECFSLGENDNPEERLLKMIREAVRESIDAHAVSSETSKVSKPQQDGAPTPQSAGS